MEQHHYQSQDIKELAKALLSVQKSLQPAVKDAVNPFVKNRYASLNSVMEPCREALFANGIWLCQYPVPVLPPVSAPAYDASQHCPQPYTIGLVTKLTHVESGQWQSSLAVIPLPKPDPQGMGTAITYARRYALSAMLGIVAEDDCDGELNKAPTHKTTPPRTTKQAPATQSRAQAQKSQPPAQQVQQSQQNQQPPPMQNGLPQLNGVVYESFSEQGQDGISREVIAATGNTIPNKTSLMQCGFKWNPQNKYWWKYADAQ